MRSVDLTGQKFGRLTVLKKAEKPKHLKAKKSYWLVRCECGNEKVLVRTALTCGNTLSCGCLMEEVRSERSATHRLSKSRFYNIWHCMKRRCENVNDNQYHNYGGRGIKLCDRWHKFENFRDDMYDSYLAFEAEHGKDTASIDRIDSNKNYEPSNCRWATQLQQARNRGNNISVKVNGVQYATLTEVAEAYGIEYQTVAERYRRGKRDAELVKPVRAIAQKTKTISPSAIKVEVNGVVYDSLTALQKDYPYISLVSISKRYKAGKRGEELIHCPKTKAIST